MRTTLLLHLPFLAEQGCGQLSDAVVPSGLAAVLAFRVLLAESIPLPTTSTTPTEGQAG